MVDAFEERLAQKISAKYAVSCSSGTAALHIAACSLDIKKNDKVIVPSITFVATANAVRYLGGEVIFSDVDEKSGLMKPSHLKEALDRAGSGVRAIFPVHLAGQCADMAAIAKIARDRGISVVEDASHAIGTTYKNDVGEFKVGSCAHSDMTVFSFHPVKTVAMGEGGGVSTQDKQLAEKLRLFRSHGITRERNNFVNEKMALDNLGENNPWYYEMQELGFNYRASDIHCALGLSQLEKLDQFIKLRHNLALHYDKALKSFSPIIKPISKEKNCSPAYHLYQVLIDFDKVNFCRSTLIKKLHEMGIGSQVHYIPAHKQPYYMKRYGTLRLPGAEKFYNKCLSLPLYSDLKFSEIDVVIKALKKLFHTASDH